MYREAAVLPNVGCDGPHTSDQRPTEKPSARFSFASPLLQEQTVCVKTANISVVEKLFPTVLSVGTNCDGR